MVFEQILLGVAGNGATALLEVLFRAVRGEKDGLDNLGGLLVGLGIEIDDPEVGRLREWLQNTGIHKTCRLLATGLSKENVAALVANDIACSVLLVDDPSQCPAGTSLTDWKRWNLDRAALIERNLGDCVLAALPLPKQTQLLGQLAAAITVGQGGTERERAALEERIKPLANSAAVGYPFRRPVEQPPAHMRAAELLSGDHRLIPFIDRTGALKELAEWCVDTDAGPLAAQVVYGAGGTGKTRLATELCHEMRKRGWVGGIFQQPHSNQTGQIDALLDATEPRLVVFDYADTQPNEVADFLDGAERRVLRKSAAVRVVLIVRRQDTSDDPRKFFISKVARRQLAATEPLRLSEPKSTTAVGFGSEQRKAMYEAASTAIARRLGAPVTALAAPENLSGDPWGSPLLVVARALIETAPAEGEHQPIGKAASSQEVLDELLIREERFWDKANCPQTQPELRRRAVAVATMFAPTSEPDAVEILRFSPLSENVQSTASWLHTLHHGPRYANPLVPDLLAERLIHQEATIEWIKRAIDPDLMLLDPYPLETLTRTIGTSDEFRSIVAPLFNGAVAEITERLCASQAAAVGRCANAVAFAIAATAPNLEQLPPPSVSTLPAAVLTAEIETRRVELLRPQGGPDLASSLNNLSNRLGEAGRREEALTAIEEAVTIRRGLAEANMAAYGPRPCQVVEQPVSRSG